MNKGDFIWTAVLAAVLSFFILPDLKAGFLWMTANHPYIMGFIKFAILATMGELLALRLRQGSWGKPKGLHYRTIIWGVLGMSFAVVFEIFSSGILGAQGKSLLPGQGSPFITAFLTSCFLNLIFGSVFMLAHRYSDAYIDLAYMKYGKMGRITLTELIAAIDMKNFIAFVLGKTVLFFWIPAHTVTFYLPSEYRIAMAAVLSICLGAILSFAKKISAGT